MLHMLLNIELEVAEGNRIEFVCGFDHHTGNCFYFVFCFVFHNLFEITLYSYTRPKNYLCIH